MKIGIFGGSFDPIHLGHLAGAEQVLEKKACDKIWFMPCYQNPLKKEHTIVEHRKKMIELAIKEEENFELSEFELKKEKTNYTIETMRELKEKFPEHDFYFIIASKVIKEMEKWKNYEKLLKEVKFIIIPTPSKEIPKEMEEFKPVKLNPTISGSISSTMIREGIKEKKDVSFLLPKTVFEYIKENKLYGFT